MTLKWTNWRMNKRLMRELYERYSASEFRNADAYKLYAESPKVEENGYWQQMSVRNSLSMAAYLGILERIEPGRYRFLLKPDEWQNIIDAHKETAAHGKFDTKVRMITRLAMEVVAVYESVEELQKAYASSDEWQIWSFITENAKEIEQVALYLPDWTDEHVRDMTSPD